MLKTIEPILRNHISKINATEVKRQIDITFVREGAKSRKVPCRRRANLLDNARDWMIQIDYETENVVFPPEICPTTLRPDIVIGHAAPKQ